MSPENNDYDKEAYNTAKTRKQQHLRKIADFWKKTQTNAVLLRTTDQEKTLQSIHNFKFMVVPTIQKQDGTWGITRWIPYNEWVNTENSGLRIDYYTILPNEIVIESDYTAKTPDGKADPDMTWNHPVMGQKTNGDKIRETLKKHHIIHNQGFSGGKGPHTHIYYNLPDKETITRMEKKGILFRDLRVFLFHKILDMAGIPTEYRTRGGVMDISCVDWNETTGRGHLVRCYGGRKFKETEMIGYKTLFTNGIPGQRPQITNFTQVVYPEKIEPWNIPPELLDMLIDTFKPSAQFQHTTKTNIIIKGMHVNLPCMRLIRNTPVFSGSRNEACRQLAYACIKDKILVEKAMTICDEFYSNVDKQDFDFSEAKYIFEWAYRRNNKDVYISCPLIKKQGFCNDKIKENCELHRKRRKEFIDNQQSKTRKKQGVQYYMGIPINDDRQPEQLKPYSRKPTAWMKEKRRRGRR